MNFLSKDAPLEESITKMKAVLAEVGCEITFAQEKHPLENCYSVNIASVEAPEYIYSNGKGSISNASVASALGEYIERLQTNLFFMDFHLPERKYYPDEVVFAADGPYLNDELRSFYNPEEELTPADLVDFNSDHGDKILSLPFIKQSSGEKVFIPLNILNNLYLSNGMSTGNTPQEAQVQALSEIFERYVKIEIIKNGYSLPSYPDELVQSFDKLHNDIQTLRELGYIVEVLDASLDGKFPVTAISLINPKSSSLFVSFGSHPILEVSLERTMTELMQGRGLDNLDEFETPTFDMDFVSDSFNLESHYINSDGKLGFKFLSATKSFTYSSWLYHGAGCQDEYNYLTDLLDTMDKEIYLREYSYLGFYSCQMIIPGISEVYPIDDLVYNNKNRGKLIRNMVLNFEDYEPEDILDYIDELDDSLDVGRYIGVIFKKSFTILDFKAQMYLALGNLEEALFALEEGTSKLGHIVAELLRLDKAELDWEDYETSLFNVFSRDRVEQGLRIVKGEAPLIQTTLHTDYQNILAMYDNLQIKKQRTP